MNSINPTVIAGYWDRAANHNTEMQQYVKGLEEMTGENYHDLLFKMQLIQKQISRQRARWQAKLPKGHG